MNDIAKERISSKLLKAIADEGMTTTEVSKALGINHDHYVSMIKNQKLWNKAPKSAWDAALQWINSGQTLKGYSSQHSRVLPRKDEPMPKDHQVPFVPDIENVEVKQRAITAIQKTAQTVKEEAQRNEGENAPFACQRLKNANTEQYFTDTASMKVVLDVDLNLNLVINGKRITL